MGGEGGDVFPLGWRGGMARGLLEGVWGVTYVRAKRHVDMYGVVNTYLSGYVHGLPVCTYVEGKKGSE